MSKRTLRWPFLYAFLLALSLACVCFGATSSSQGSVPETPVVTHVTNPADQREFQNVYQAIKNPTINKAVISSATISSLIISTMTVSSFTATNATASTFTVTNQFNIVPNNPIQISSNMNVSGLLSLSNAAATALTIQGFSGGIAGQVIFFFNDSTTNNVTFVYSGSGTQAFSFQNRTNLIIGPLGGAIFTYNGQNGVWVANAVSGQIGNVGRHNGEDASVGNTGEYISSTVLVGSAGSQSSLTPRNITSIVLTPGDWDITTVFGFDGNGATSGVYVRGSISTTSATENTTAGFLVSQPLSTFLQTQDILFSIAGVRETISSNTTVYMVSNANFSAGTVASYGRISARRL